MIKSCNFNLARLVLWFMASTVSIGTGFAQSPTSATSNLKTTAGASSSAGTRCTTMRCITNADRVAASKRAAAIRSAAAPTRKISATTQVFGRQITRAAVIPVQTGCAAPVMNPGGTPDYMSGCVGNYANSPLPTLTGTVAPVSISSTGIWSGPTVTGTVTGGIRKFIDPLPSIPIAVPDKKSYPNSDYYEIELIETSQKMHTDLPPTTLRLYHQTNQGMDANGGNVVNPPAASSLGPLIIAQKGTPVRIKFTNKLTVGGKLFLPVDPTVMGAGMGPDGSTYSENRANLHLHGGNTPWISDGTPHQWTAPLGEPTSVLKGVSTQDVPDMPPTKAGEMTFYYTNDQSARLMFYHDHSYGITRLNVYAGVAAGYIVQDSIEATLIKGGTITPPIGSPITVAAETIPSAQIPLVIQDKTFIPPADQLAAQDPTWNWGPKDVSGNFLVGNLWFPHVYMTNQNPSDDSGANAMGRWDWGPWFWPVMDTSTLVPEAAEWACPTAAIPGQMCPGTPKTSLVPEAFLDTPVINGEAYPVLSVSPKPYRLRILNATNDRFLNLMLYQATDATGALCNTAALPTGTGVASCTEVRHITAPDGIASQGPLPDPLTKGPQMIQIGNEAGFIANPVVLDNQPIVYNYNRRDIVVLNVQNKNLWLGPAERADVIVDFSAFAGKTLILYNDSGAPVPAFDTRNDYYTGDPDQTAQGGAPMTLPGYGPNTRTMMQIQVAATGATTAFDQAALAAALPAAFAASQPPPVIPEPDYNAAYATTYPTTYSRIGDTSLFTGSLTSFLMKAGGSGYTAPPTVIIAAPSLGGTPATATAILTAGKVSSVTLTNPGSGYYSTPVISLKNAVGDTTGASAVAVAVGLPMLRKTIQELFELDYGRMNATLGLEMAFTNFANQTTIPLGYIDPPTESFVDGQPQLWKITHNGVDTHAIHFHLFNVQVINRVGWDGAVRPPDANEIGWKETVKMSPLEDVIVAFKPVKQTLPFSIPDSIRLEDVTKLVGAPIRIGDVNGGTPVTIANPVLNFGQEYVWHCHLLGHEENDMMRPMIFQVAPEVPSGLDAVRVGTGLTANVTFVNNSAAVIQSNAPANSTGFTLQRDTVSSFTAPTSTQIPSSAAGIVVGSTVTFTDPSVQNGPAYYYRAQSFTPNGTSAWSNIAQLGTTLNSPVASVSPTSLTFATQALATTSAPQIVTLSNIGGPMSGIGIAVSAGFGQTSTCLTTLAAGASCTISVTFTPTATGSQTGSLTITTSDPVNPTVAVSLTGQQGTAPAVMLSPAPGGRLPGSTVTFSWTPGAGVSYTSLWIGTAPGANNVFDSLPNYRGGTSVTTSVVPTLGALIYVRLWSQINGSWLFNDYTYTEASTLTPAALLSPATGSVLAGSTVTFSWTTNAAAYVSLWIGTTQGTNNLFDSLPNYSGATSVTASALPTNGVPVYVRLWSQVNGAWKFIDYTYTEAGAPTPAAMLTPIPGSSLVGPSATFNWIQGPGVSYTSLWIGTTPGTNNLFDSLPNFGGATSATASGLPIGGVTIYVRLWSQIAGAWRFNDYTYLVN